MTRSSRSNRIGRRHKKTSKSSVTVLNSTKKGTSSVKRRRAGRRISPWRQPGPDWWQRCSNFGRAIVEHWRLALAQIFIIICVFVLILGRLPPVTVLTSDLKNDTVAPGGLLEESHTVRWNRTDCISVTVTADLIDALGYMHTFASKTLGLTRRPTMTAREWFVPMTMPPGRTIYQGRLSLSCFPYFSVWPIVVEAHPLTFTVVQP